VKHIIALLRSIERRGKEIWNMSGFAARCTLSAGCPIALKEFLQLQFDYGYVDRDI